MLRNPYCNHHVKCERLQITNLTFVEDVLLFAIGDCRSVELMIDRHLVSLSKYLTVSAQLYRIILKDIESTWTNNQTYHYLLVLCKSKVSEKLIRGKLILKLK